MHPDPIDLATRLAAWHAQQRERQDTLHSRFIDALARRIGYHQGQARHLLEQKLVALLDTDADEPAKVPPQIRAMAGSAAESDAIAASTTQTSARTPQPGPLGALLAQRSMLAADMLRTDAIASPLTPTPTPQLQALEDARQLWTELRSRSQLRQSLRQAPTDAGPLNSGVLVHRALTLMRTLSPGYLQHFLSYVDTLSWLQQLHDDGVLAKAPAPNSTPTAKPVRGKSSKRG
ncbi:DUF2894 domain-containing protein [Xanthomonas albilineans]|uniref:DUF2894 domain-containing protein n=1 Tax=Xanthomonas albilineans TaxID=29447 RepID=UPI0005F30D89|nr:DUF2894 domain-containing protein [Xanthomonas albilineans]